MNDADAQKVHTSGENRIDFDICENVEVGDTWFVKFSLTMDTQINWLKTEVFEKGVSNKMPVFQSSEWIIMMDTAT